MHTAIATNTLKYRLPSAAYQYLLVAQPDQLVTKKILQEKQNINITHQHSLSIEIQPAITIADFTASEAMEETIIRYLYRVYSNMKSFHVSFNNYGGFPPDIVYLRILDHIPFRQAATELKVINSYLLANGCSPVHHSNTPHLTIAQNLPETVYHQVLMDYSQKSFHETFLVNEFVLLKNQANDEQCKKMGVFRLQPPINDLNN